MPKVHHYVKSAIALFLVFLVTVYVMAVVTSLSSINARERFTPSQLADKAGKFAEIGDAKVYYEYFRSTNTPAKATVLLLHGFGANLHSWDKQVPYLRVNYDVLAVDMLGYGLSQEIGSSTLGEEAQSAMIVKLMAQLAIGKVYIIGNSMGGGVAQRLALNVPAKVAGLILVNSVDLSSRPSYETLAWVNNPLMAEIPFGIAISEDNIAAILASAYGDQTLMKSEDIAAYYKPYTVKGSTHNLIMQAFAPSSDRLVETAKITQPVLLITGSSDTWIQQSIRDHLKSGLPNKETAMIQGAGHVAHEENPTEVNQLIGNWLDRMSTGK